MTTPPGNSSPSNPPSIVAVTGATGFIGTALCRSLREAGRPVRALVRTPSQASKLAALGVDIIAGDLADTTALAQLVEGAGVIVHAAGAVRGRCQADFDAVNVAGTRALLAAMGETPAASLCLLSSLVAREPELSWYSRSKWAGEALVTSRDDLRWTVLRPPAVYGPGDREMLPIFRTMAKGLATVPGSPASRISLVHVDDLVAAIVACLDSEPAKGQVMELDDGKPGGYDWTEIATIAGHVFGRRVRVWRVPGLLLDAVAAINLALAGITATAPMLTPPKLRELRHSNWVADSTALRDATGWEPTINLATGLKRLEN